MAFLILPARNVSRSRVLMPVRESEWRSPSLAQQKDQFGNETQTRFRIRGRLHDGRVKFALWFDDRDAFDAFAFDLIRHEIEHIPFPIEHWREVNEVWGEPDLWPGLQYDFATLSFITSTSGSNQTWTSPSDWNNSSNQVEVVAGGGTGPCLAASTSISAHRTGGGGGAYSIDLNLSVAVPGTTTKTFFLNAAVSTSTSSGSAVSQNGADAWFDGTTLAGSTVGAQHGVGGAFGSGNISGGAAGSSASGTGSTKNSGGRGGNLTGASGSGASGGGSGAGPNGAGINGVDSSSTGTLITTAGAIGDNGFGGSSGQTGGDGTEWDASHGIGGSSNGQAASVASGSRISTAGNYGSGAGGVHLERTGSGTATSTASQGIIVITYTPAVAGVLYTQLERGIRGYLRGVTPGTLH